MLIEVINSLGWAFHPDEPLTEDVCRDYGEPSYTLKKLMRLDCLMDAFVSVNSRISTFMIILWKSARKCMATSLQNNMLHSC